MNSTSDESGNPPDAPKRTPIEGGNLPEVPKVIPDDETDGRALDDWKSRYPMCVRVQIWIEAIVVASIQICALLILFFVWNGFFADYTKCASCNSFQFKKYAYFFVGGVLGGTLFGIKYLYHAVARGFWNQDRRLWRFLSPLLSGTLALVVGALTEAGFLGLAVKSSTASAYVSLGFIAGYFGDKALRKMTDIAEVIFSVHNTEK